MLSMPVCKKCGCNNEIWHMVFILRNVIQRNSLPMEPRLADCTSQNIQFIVRKRTITATAASFVVGDLFC
uniref:Secreted protein n=1 Tax=Ascaris lumbricoides TaxID=6252 RepID=A0A0M3HVW1_ASCLU